MEGFFGWRRFNYGATSSMADGLHVARLLVGGGGGGGGCGGANNADIADEDGEVPPRFASWEAFSARRWQDIRRWRRMVIPRVFVLLLVALVARVVLCI